MVGTNGASSSSPRQYTCIKVRQSPIGELRECRHAPSGERRGLKVMRADLAEKKKFLGWYGAALTMAGEAAEFLHLPTLIGPIRAPDGKWLSFRNGEYVVERLFFGSEEDPAWNLSEFVELSQRNSRGVDETVALAVMSMVAATLRIMNGTKLSGAHGVQLACIPHLNLKPQNVIIGRDPRTQKYQVRLTDFLTAMAAPRVEESGVRAPLNYSSPEVLQDNAYIALSADIFSCGLLLYRLVENKELIPGNISRNNVLEYIRQKLPARLENLKLTEAKGRTCTIIQRCLTGSEAERYDTVDELKEEIDRALTGAEPAEILNSSIVRPTVEPKAPPRPPRPVKPVRPSPWPRRIKRLAKVAAAAVVVVVLVLTGNFALNKYRKMKAERKRDAVEIHWSGITDLRCLPAKRQEQIQADLDRAGQSIIGGDYKLALNEYERISLLLGEINGYCNRYSDVQGRAREALGQQDYIIDFERLWRKLQAAMDSACQEAGREDYSAAALYLAEAEDYLVDSMVWRCDELVKKARAVLGGFDAGNPCRGEAEILYRSIARACDDRDSQSFEYYGQRLDTLASRSDCQPPLDCRNELRDLRGILEKIKEACYGKASSLVKEAELACQNQDHAEYARAKEILINISRQPGCAITPCAEGKLLLDSARTTLAQLRQKYNSLDIAFDQNDGYSDAASYVQRADSNLQKGNCPAVEFSATSANSILRDVEPCIASVDGVLRFRDSLNYYPDLAGEFDQDMDVVDSYLEQWDCARAGEELDKLWGIFAEAIEDLWREDIVTYDSCWDKFRNYDHNAWRVCEQVSPSDSLYSDAMKMFVIAAGREKKFQCDFRERLQVGLDASSVTSEVTDWNAAAYITMVLVYGWDTSCIDVNRALRYHEEARHQGYAAQDNPDWWMAMLVAARCHFKRWQESRTPMDKEDAIDAVEGFLDTAEEKDIDESYVDEVNSYYDSLVAY